MATPITPELRLKRYLCYTSESNIYLPGCRYFHKLYSLENVPSLTELLADNKLDAVLDLIKSVHEEKTSCYPDALLFVLAEICRDKETRKKGLELAMTLVEPFEAYDSFIAFIKFCVEREPKTGYGRSMRKFMQEWYLKKSHLELLEVVGDKRKFRGWSHKDIFNLCHLKAEEATKKAIFTYAVKGVDAMVKEFGDTESKDVKDIMSYITIISEYRKKTDVEEVVEKIDSYELNRNHIHHKLLLDKKIWMSLLKQMPVNDVLQNFQYMSKHKMFRTNRNWDTHFVDSVAEGLTKPYGNRQGVVTSRVFIELMKYENAGRIKQDLAIKLKHTVKKAPIINEDLTNAFIELLGICFEELEKPTGKKIMVVIEQSQEMLKRRCNSSRYITLTEAAGYIAYYFFHVETNTKLFTYNANGFKEFTVSKEANVKQLISTLKGETVPEPSQKGKGDEHITNWLKENGEEYDVCIILKSYLDNNSLHSLVHLKVGKTGKKLRYIVSDLCGIPKNCKPPDKKNLFVTSGFDEKLVNAMQIFSKEVF